MLETTYDGLMKWYVNQIEKLGWIVDFSQNEDDIEHKNKKISLYIESLNKLKKCIESKIETINDKDKKNDLIIIHKRLFKFIPIASTILNIDKKSVKRSSRKSSKK